MAERPVGLHCVGCLFGKHGERTLPSRVSHLHWVPKRPCPVYGGEESRRPYCVRGDPHRVLNGHARRAPNGCRWRLCVVEQLLCTCAVLWVHAYLWKLAHWFASIGVSRALALVCYVRGCDETA
jgi:hypothetical protein